VQPDCLFCQIIRRERPAEFVYEDASLVIFKDAHPHAPVHLLVVPTKHIRSINDLKDEDRKIIAEMIFKARDVARQFSVSTSGYKLAFNVERGAGQVIFHLHMHLVGGWGRTD
jgi:histidine triad (HIT) family protein